MNKQSAIKFLNENSGYLKKSASYLADKLNISELLAKEVLAIAKNKKVAQNASNSVLKPFTKGESRVLVISDTHEPFCRKGYLEFCQKVAKEYKTNQVVHIGDEVDLCALSQWEKDPDGLSAGSEFELALTAMKKWYKAFPEVKVCIGNHSERMFRLARTIGIPKRFLKTYEDIWEAPKGWKWNTSWEIDGALYLHGTGMTGPNAAITKAQMLRQNVCIGHIHTEAGVKFSASSKDLVWGMQVGGAIDDKAYAFAYAKEHLKKSIVGCAVVINGKLPIYIPMNL